MPIEIGLGDLALGRRSPSRCHTSRSGSCRRCARSGPGSAANGSRGSTACAAAGAPRGAWSSGGHLEAWLPHAQRQHASANPARHEPSLIVDPARSSSQSRTRRTRPTSSGPQRAAGHRSSSGERQHASRQSTSPPHARRADAGSSDRRGRRVRAGPQSECAARARRRRSPSARARSPTAVRWRTRRASRRRYRRRRSIASRSRAQDSRLRRIVPPPPFSRTGSRSSSGTTRARCRWPAGARSARARFPTPWTRTVRSPRQPIASSRSISHAASTSTPSAAWMIHGHSAGVSRQAFATASPSIWSEWL